MVISREQYYLDLTDAAHDEKGYNTHPTADSCLGVKRDAAFKNRVSNWNKKNWQDPEYRKRHIELKAKEFQLEKDGVVYTGKNISQLR